MELTGDIRRPELSPVVEESSPDSDRSTPQPTIPLEDHLGDLLALPPARQQSRPSETVQLEADLGAMLAAVRPSPPKEQDDVTMEDAALDTTQLLASLGLDDASLSKDAQNDVLADDETGKRLAAALAAAELTGDDDDGALVAATLAAEAKPKLFERRLLKYGKLPMNVEEGPRTS